MVSDAGVPTADGVIHAEDIQVQHNRLNGYLQQLQGSHSPNHWLQTFQDFISYFELHASDEEQFMRAHGYPDLEEHCRAHNELLSAFRDFQSVVASEPAGQRAWELWPVLSNHYEEFDRKYFEYFQSRGVIPVNVTLYSYEK